MKFELNKVLTGLDGEPIKNTYQQSKFNKPLTIRDLMIIALTTERLFLDGQNPTVINQKTDTDKFDDYKLGIKISNTSQVDIDLDKDECDRIKKLSHFLQTELYGAFMMEFEKKKTTPIK